MAGRVGSYRGRLNIYLRKGEQNDNKNFYINSYGCQCEYGMCKNKRLGN